MHGVIVKVITDPTIILLPTKREEFLPMPEVFIIPDGAIKIEDRDYYTEDGSRWEIPGDITSVKIPDSVTEIGYHAFSDCSSIEEIKIPDTVTKIGDCAFSGCDSLREINVSPGNRVFHDEDGVLFEGNKLRTFPPGKRTHTYTIPDSVTEIGDWAFCGCSSLSEINIPDSVTKIGEYAFGSCSSLREINIPDSVTKIADWAFSGCDSLEEIDIPDSVTEIGDWAFSACDSLERVYAPEHLDLSDTGLSDDVQINDGEYDDDDDEYDDDDDY